MSEIPDSFLTKGERKIPVRQEPEPVAPKQLKNRRTIFVDDREWESFKKKAAANEITISEMLRRLVRRWKPTKKD